MNPARRLSRLSIRARLTLWYAASVLAALLVFAAMLRSTVRATLTEEFSASLEASAGAVRGFFRLEYAEYRDVETTLRHIAEEVVFPGRVIEFVSPAGRPAHRTLPAPVISGAGAEARAATALAAPIRTTTSPLAPDLAPGWSLRVRASAATLERSLRIIDRWLRLGIPLGVLLAAAAGWWLAGRTLRPVGEMAAAADQMMAVRLASGPGESSATTSRLPITNPSDELGRLGARFNALLDQVDAVVAQQRRFLADAAHELRTPIARMLGGAELALLDPDDAPAQRDALERVHRDLGRTARLVDELLQLARADASGTVHTREGFVDDVVADVVHAWLPAAERRGVRLTASVLDEAPALLDPVYLERLAGILLDNAIRYTPSGGRVDVRVFWEHGARLIVTDTGIGISAPDCARVFERFYRGPGARVMAPDGSGLGLPIARWIAEAHGATLTLEAGEKGGTIATLAFPRAPGRPDGDRERYRD